jgi:hypothetical protein
MRMPTNSSRANRVTSRASRTAPHHTRAAIDRRRSPRARAAVVLPLFLLTAMVMPVRATAQGPAIAPMVLTAPASTRALGVGDAYTALGADADVIFYNPGQLVPARGIGVGIQRYDEGSALITVSAAQALAPGTIGLGVQILDQATSAPSYRALARSGEPSLFSRGPTLATGALITVGYARTIFGFRVGGAGKVVHQQFGNQREATPAFDVGISRGSTYQLALVGRHLGHGLDLAGATTALPREVALGGAIPRREVGPLDLAAAASIAMRADGSLAGGGGTEWSYNPLDGFTFAARIGYRAVEGAESHLTLGAGYIGERFSLDYAFQASDGDGAAHRVGVRWR